MCYDNGKTPLRPYLGEKGHLVVIRKTEVLAAQDYLHVHPLQEGQEGEIRFATRFPGKGRYRLWCQFDREGRVWTADFWVDVT